MRQDVVRPLESSLGRESLTVTFMNPLVDAAVIAGIVSLISLTGTVVVALRGFHATMQATKLTADEAHRDTADALAVQREQLDRTLGEQHVRTLNERFATAAEKLGSDKPAAVRLAGVYAMAGLADDWTTTARPVDVLCAYLRMPHPPDPGDGQARLGFLADREVRHTVTRVITAHLRDGAKVSWQGKHFDFTGVVFDGGDFPGAVFSGHRVDFKVVDFSGGMVDFSGAEFSGGEVDFGVAAFSGGKINFQGAKFSGSTVDFSGAKFSGAEVLFDFTEFSGGEVDFHGAEFSDGLVSFRDAKFSDSQVSFSSTEFCGSGVNFGYAEFSGADVDFTGANLSRAGVSFSAAEFSGGEVNFAYAEFSGADVHFDFAVFSGGEVDLSYPAIWEHPPRFTFTGTPPPGLKLPEDREA